MLLELLDLTVCESVQIKQSGKVLYSGRTDAVPYRLIRHQVIAFGFGELDEHFYGLIINV